MAKRTREPGKPAMTATPILADLREPPVVGKFYMVPAIENYPYHGRVDSWPVIGPMHTDADFFDFRSAHYHVDARFITTRQEHFLLNRSPLYSLEAIVGGYPLSSRGDELPKGRPKLVRRKCRRAIYGYAYGGMEAVQRMRHHYGDPAAPIRLQDGRLLCPHRKVDLSQFPADAEGIVTCPLHGLRVRCGTALND